MNDTYTGGKIENVNKGICQGRAWEGNRKNLFVNWREDGKNKYAFFETVSGMHTFYESLKRIMLCNK